MRLRAPTATSRLSASRVRTLPTTVWLIVIVGVSAALRFALASSATAPSILPDELLYSEFAKSFAASGEFLVRDVSYSAWTFGPLYAVVLAPAYLIASLPDAYAVSKAVGSIVMSLAAVPAYFIARRMLDRRLALLSSALAVSLPAMAYSSRVMTENLFYPVFLSFVLATVLLLEAPTLRRELIVLGTIGVACLVRTQGVALFAALLGAIIFQAALDVDRTRPWLTRFFREVRRYPAVLTALVTASVVGFILWNEPSVKATERARQVVADVDTVAVPKWIVYHIGELALVVGFIPLVAFILLTRWAVSSEPKNRRAQAFVSTTAAVTVVLVLLASAFGTQFHRIVERYMFYVEPLLLIALVAWIYAGRPYAKRSATAAAVLGLALLPIALYVESLFSKLYDAPGLGLWASIDRMAGGVALGLGLAVFGAAALLLIRRADSNASVLAPVVAYLVISSLFTAARFQDWSARSVELGLGGGDRTWIDHTVGAGANVTVVSSARRNDWARHVRIWISEFFNRSVGSVYVEEPSAWDLPSTLVSPQSGRLLLPDGSPLRAQYVLSDGPVIAGRRVASKPEVDLVLYRVDGPVRLAGVQK